METAVEWLIEQLELDDSKIARVIGLKKYNQVVSQAKEMEKQQQDDFAIGFLDFAKNKTDYDSWDSKFDYKGVLYNSKELLEIYKKEKGL